MHHSAVLGDVDVLAGGHVSNLALQVRGARKLMQQVHRLRRHALAAVIQHDALELSSKSLATVIILHWVGRDGCFTSVCEVRIN